MLAMLHLVFVSVTTTTFYYEKYEKKKHTVSGNYQPTIHPTTTKHQVPSKVTNYLAS